MRQHTSQNGEDRRTEGAGPNRDAGPPADFADASIASRLGARVLTEVSDAAAPPLLVERLEPIGHTILFGTGGAGKGILATEWLRRLLIRTDARVLIADYEDHAEEWSRRFTGLGGDKLRSRVQHVSPLGPGWRGTRGAIWDQADELRALAMEWRATYLVVDSIVTACGATDPLKPEAAGQYAAALTRIGLPALSLAHLTKNGQTTYPFGSVFWHNLARLTWSLTFSGQGGALLVNRKANNYPGGSRFTVDVTWREGLPRVVSERRTMSRLAERIAEVLIDHPDTVKGIVTKLDAAREEGEDLLKAGSVRTALSRSAKANGPFKLVEGRWTLQPS